MRAIATNTLSSRMSRLRAACIAMSMALSLSACVSVARTQSAAAPACATGERAMTRETLYFGRNRPDGGRVDDAQWQGFVDDVVTPLFPDGFTVLSANGQWRGANGSIERESSMVLIVLHAGDAESKRAIAAIVDEYKQRFAQEAVLRERGTSCASF